jgi:hypothetical protein
MTAGSQPRGGGFAFLNPGVENETAAIFRRRFSSNYQRRQP